MLLSLHNLADERWEYVHELEILANRLLLTVRFLGGTNHQLVYIACIYVGLYMYIPIYVKHVFKYRTK